MFSLCLHWWIFSLDIEFWVVIFFQHLENVLFPFGFHGFWWEIFIHLNCFPINNASRLVFLWRGSCPGVIFFLVWQTLPWVMFSSSTNPTSGDWFLCGLGGLLQRATTVVSTMGGEKWTDWGEAEPPFLPLVSHRTTLVVLGLEGRALCLLGRRSSSWAMPLVLPFIVSDHSHLADIFS
jgi:hypothetical protein